MKRYFLAVKLKVSRVLTTLAVSGTIYSLLKWSMCDCLRISKRLRRNQCILIIDYLIVITVWCKSVCVLPSQAHTSCVSPQQEVAS